MATNVGNPKVSCPNKQTEEPEEKQNKKKHWIKFEFIDNENDDPISDVKVLVKLPDGSEEEHASDNDGLIEVKNIDSGSCTLSSYSTGVVLTSVLDFVSINGQSNQNKESTNISAPIQANPDDQNSKAYKYKQVLYKKIAIIKEYKVKTGDSLEKIAKDSGISWEELSFFNWGTRNPNQINWFLREYVGCRKRTRDNYNYIFTSDDDPGIVFIPQQWSRSGFKTGSLYKIRLRLRYYFSSVQVQTVDEFGIRYGNTTIVLKSEDGWPDVEITTDEKGYGKKKQVLSGKYKIAVKGKGPAYFLKDLNKLDIDPETKGDKLGEYTEAVFNTKDRDKAILRIVVTQNATKEEIEARHLIKHNYSRSGKKTVVKGRGEETKGETCQSVDVCADNLALAAGWKDDYKEVNIKNLVSNILPSYLNDYYPIAIKRNYYVFLLDTELKEVSLVNSRGNVEVTFNLTQEVRGWVGAYAYFFDDDKFLFRDITSTSYAIFDPSDPSRIFPIEEIIEPEKKGDLVECINNHANEIMLVYLIPTASQLMRIALVGGTGKLEDYGGDSSVKNSIHKRNLLVCRHIRDIYNIYIKYNYIDKIKKTKSEDELRKIGPPKSPYQMPAPANSTQLQLLDIYSAISTNELDAWLAIAHKLDDINNRKSQGYPFLRLKMKYKKEIIKKKFVRNTLKQNIPIRLAGEVEVEALMDIQPREDGIRILGKGDTLVKGKCKFGEKIIGQTKNGYPVEIGYKQSLLNPEKTRLNLNLAYDFFKIEIDTLGKAKYSLQPFPGVFADSELNTRTGTFGGGVTISGKALLKKFPEKFQKKLKWLDGLELQLLMGFVGTREETILAIVSYAPGFFERRSLLELFHPHTKWVDLTFDEQTNLVTLGWLQRTWDYKYTKAGKKLLPNSVNKPPIGLTAAEKIAIVHLGFYSYVGYKRIFRKTINKHADYDF